MAIGHALKPFAPKPTILVDFRFTFHALQEKGGHAASCCTARKCRNSFDLILFILRLRWRAVHGNSLGDEHKGSSECVLLSISQP